MTPDAIPDGATHYAGEPTGKYRAYFKRQNVCGVYYWFKWDVRQPEKGWALFSRFRPFDLKEIS